MTTINPDKLKQAREWARDNLEKGHFLHGERVMAAAEVIAALPDTIVDGAKVQELIETYEHARDENAKGSEGWVINHLMVSNLKGLLPAPKNRTLADMTPEERQECQFMPARVEALSKPGIITHVGDRDVVIMAQECDEAEMGAVEREKFKNVIPLPDLPRLEWPASKPLDPTDQQNLNDMPVDDVAAATGGELTTQDVVDECRAVRKERARAARTSETPPAETQDSPSSHVPRTLPRPEEVPTGEAWMIRPYENAYPVPAFRVAESKYGPGKRWAYSRTGGSMVGFTDDEDVTLIARLVPEKKPRELNTELDFRGAPIGTVAHWNHTVAEKKGPSSWFTTAGHWNLNNAEMSLRGLGTVIWEPEVGQ